MLGSLRGFSFQAQNLLWRQFFQVARHEALEDWHDFLGTRAKSRSGCFCDSFRPQCALVFVDVHITRGRGTGSLGGRTIPASSSARRRGPSDGNGTIIVTVEVHVLMHVVIRPMGQSLLRKLLILDAKR